MDIRTISNINLIEFLINSYGKWNLYDDENVEIKIIIYFDLV